MIEPHRNGPGGDQGQNQKASVAGLVAWALYDWANSAYTTVILTFVFAAYFTRHVATNQTIGSVQWGNAISAGGLVVALSGPILGAVADQGGRRKPWIGAFMGVCVVCTALLWFVKPAPSYVWLALPLVGLATMGYEFSNVFYNAMLPSLASEENMGRWSGWAWSIGYAGGLACLVIALFGFVKSGPWFEMDRASARHVRATFLLVAAWFFVFAMPLFAITPDTPSRGKRFRQAATDGLRQIADSMRQVRHYGHIVRFLIARMMYNDGLTTLFAFGGVYAAGTFDMNESKVLAFGITLNVTAGLGAAAFAWLDDWMGSKRTILFSLVGLIVAGTAILVVRAEAWFWALGMLLGIFVGPVQAASRTFLARATPASLSNQMFGLYALSGKATAFLGPLLVGWITYWAGSQRVGMGTIVVLLTVGLAVMLTVPEGRQEKQSG